MKSAMTYFPAEQYHRQRKFHFCVRDGNRCFLSLIVTDKSLNILSDPQGGMTNRRQMSHERSFDRTRVNYKRELLLRYSLKQTTFVLVCIVPFPLILIPNFRFGTKSRRKLVDKAKHSTDSTAELNELLRLHMRPINPVVYRGSYVLRHGIIIFRGASRLDAFSGYPCRT